MEAGLDSVTEGGNKLPSWRFHLENLGCITSGDFEVKPLTLLCGPNNTGKTWAMYALYGFLANSYSLLSVLPMPGIDGILKKITKKGIYSWDFGTWLETYADDLLGIINQGMQKRLPEIFNAPRHLFSNSRYDWVIDREKFVQSGINRSLKVEFGIGANSLGLSLLKDCGESNLQITLLSEEFPDLKFFITSVLLAHLLGEKNTCFLLPTERNGLNIFYKELAYKRTALFHPSTRGKLSLADISDYPEPIANYIDWLNKIPELIKLKTKDYHSLAGQVETMVNGNYAVDTLGNVSFSPEVSGESLDLHLSSSTVKSLFGLWFYLEHEAKRGDTLMIDEPELNLHPSNQRALARLLASLVNAGLRVVVSTHSDYIVREINSLIMLHQPHPKRNELMQRYGYHEGEILKPEKVGCYLFDQSTIKPMEITQDEGILATTFDEIIHDLNDTSDNIYYTYRETNDEAVV